MNHVPTVPRQGPRLFGLSKLSHFQSRKNHYTVARRPQGPKSEKYAKEFLAGRAETLALRGGSHPPPSAGFDSQGGRGYTVADSDRASNGCHVRF